MVKILQLKQPYASMLVHGLMDVVHLDTCPEQTPSRILVYATEPVNNLEAPLEWLQEVRNQQLYGNLPPVDSLPCNAAVGYINIFNIDYGSKSIWSRRLPHPQYPVVASHVFDHPLAIDPEKLSPRLFRKSGTHTITPIYPMAINGRLIVPVSEKVFSEVSLKEAVQLELEQTLSSHVLDDKGELIRFTSFIIQCGIKFKTFRWNEDCRIEFERTANDYDLAFYPSLASKNGKSERAILNLSCTDPQ